MSLAMQRLHGKPWKCTHREDTSDAISFLFDSFADKGYDEGINPFTKPPYFY